MLPCANVLIYDTNLRKISLHAIVDGGKVLQVIEAAKKRGQEKAKLTKSMIVLDVKPWDDTTG